MSEQDYRTTFSKYYFQNFEITLDGGRKIWLVHFEQKQTYYGGVYEGVFWGEPHPKYVDVFRKNAEEALEVPAVTIDARPIPIPVPEEHLEPYCRPYKHLPFPHSEKEVKPVSLGPITCVAYFQSNEIADKEPEGIMSHLVLVWFQQEYAMPIDPIVLDKIKAFHWEQHAVSCEP